MLALILLKPPAIWNIDIIIDIILMPLNPPPIAIPPIKGLNPPIIVPPIRFPEPKFIPAP
jgi:hypothetical protein